MTEKRMNEASRWRLELAERIAAAYARNPKSEVVMIAGSVGRGVADRHSDIEIDVYYREPPTPPERRTAVEACGAVLHDLGEDAIEWAESMHLGGFYAHTSTFLVATMERFLTLCVEEYSTDEDAQMRLNSLQRSIPVKGHDRVAQWRAKAAAYPVGLVHAMLRANLPFEGFWYGEEMLAERDDVLSLYDIFVRVQRQILGALLGLNRIYLQTPGYKWMDEVIGDMVIKPHDLSARLKRAFRIHPPTAVRELKDLIAEMLDLVEAHEPNFDTAPYRENLLRCRPVWDAPPLV